MKLLKAAVVRVFIVAKAQRDVALLIVCININTRATHLAALSTFHLSPVGVRATNVRRLVLFHDFVIYVSW